MPEDLGLCQNSCNYCLIQSIAKQRMENMHCKELFRLRVCKPQARHFSLVWNGAKYIIIVMCESIKMLRKLKSNF